jgi:hypothetical protein
LSHVFNHHLCLSSNDLECIKNKLINRSSFERREKIYMDVEMMDKTGNQRGWTGKDSNLLSMA